VGEAGQRFRRREPMEWPDEGMIAPNAGRDLPKVPSGLAGWNGKARVSVSRQCTLLGIERSSFYYQPRPTTAEELELLNRLDRIFTEHPVYGSRRLQVTLLRDGISVGRRRIRRLMRKLGLWVYRPQFLGHRIQPYAALV